MAAATGTHRGTTGYAWACGVAALLLWGAFGPAPAAAESGPAPDLSADEQVTAYAPKGGGPEARDPFQALIDPPTPVAPAPVAPPVVDERRAIPPLPLSLIAVVGNESRRLALLDMNGVTYEMAAGEAEGGGLFKVLEVTETSVTVWDSRAGKNRVIELR